MTSCEGFESSRYSLLAFEVGKQADHPEAVV